MIQSHNAAETSWVTLPDTNFYFLVCDENSPLWLRQIPVRMNFGYCQIVSRKLWKPNRLVGIMRRVRRFLLGPTMRLQYHKFGLQKWIQNQSFFHPLLSHKTADKVREVFNLVSASFLSVWCLSMNEFENSIWLEWNPFSLKATLGQEIHFGSLQKSLWAM